LNEWIAQRGFPINELAKKSPGALAGAKEAVRDICWQIRGLLERI
jgi:hypothetical protein